MDTFFSLLETLVHIVLFTFRVVYYVSFSRSMRFGVILQNSSSVINYILPVVALFVFPHFVLFMKAYRVHMLFSPFDASEYSFLLLNT